MVEVLVVMVGDVVVVVMIIEVIIAEGAMATVL